MASGVSMLPQWMPLSSASGAWATMVGLGFMVGGGDDIASRISGHVEAEELGSALCMCDLACC